MNASLIIFEWKFLPYDLPPIQAVQKEGELFSVDNRRLVAFNGAGVDKIPVQMVSKGDSTVARKLRFRFNPINGEGHYVVIVNGAGRANALTLLKEHGMINREVDTMADSQGKEYPTLSDLKRHSIWKCDEIDDLMYPVTSADEFPENSYDLLIRAIFTTRSGIELLGYVVGVENIFVIAICADDQVFYFNRNLPEFYSEDLSKLSKILGQKLTLSDFSLLKYVTDIDLEGFRNIEGEFDLLKKRTDKERLEGL